MKTKPSSLVLETDRLVDEERATLAKILKNYREIERTREYAALGYKSLFEFAVKRHKYSEDQAYARISAMKLVRELPEIKEKIESGDLNITHIVQAKRLFNKEPMNHEQKLEVFEQIAGKSTRETERITLSFASEPESLKPDRIRAVTEELSELKFVVDQKTVDKLDEFKGLIAHTHAGASLGEILKQALTLAIEKKKAEAPRKLRVIFERANYKCENCGSRHALEVDHVVPRAKGGSDAPENLRCLCQKCNQRAAIDEFGQRHMDAYLN